MNRKLVCWVLLAGILVLFRTPMDAEGRRPQDGNQDVLVLFQRRNELKSLIEKIERTLHLERERARKQPKAEEAREAMQEAQQAYQKLVAAGKSAGGPQLAEARQKIISAQESYQAVVERTLAEDPDAADRMNKLARYKAEHKRLEALLKRYAEQKS